MPRLVVRDWQLVFKRAPWLFPKSQLLSTNPLCLSWVQVVYSRLIWGVQTRGLCADLGPRPATPEYKCYALRTAKPSFSRLVIPSILRQLTTVSQLVIPIIHTANKNNNKVNYLKSYLLLIPVRSPV